MFFTQVKKAVFTEGLVKPRVYCPSIGSQNICSNGGTITDNGKKY